MTAVQPQQTNSQAAVVKLGELSREMQLGWIEKLFGRFEAMYGRVFVDMWAAANIAAVKAEWADDLRYYTGAQIAWALDQCRATCDLPPTLPKFLGLCRAAPRPEAVAALPPPNVEPEVAAARAAEVRQAAANAVGRKPGHAWAIRILEEIAAGVLFPAVSEQFAVEALEACGRLDDAPAEYVRLNRALWRAAVERRQPVLA